ncbi:MAG: LacI family DNA-binding transcriptional regulator [Chitinophagaceae bacterium]
MPGKEKTAADGNNKKHMATIVDIAKALNISKSTVSRALHEHGDINPQTREAVLKVARELDYQPNQLAQSLVNSKTNTIGIIVPEFMTYFFPTVIIGAQEVAAAAGYNVIICQSQESLKTEIANANVLLSSRVDGVLVSMTKETKKFDHFKAFERYGIPIVFFNRVCEEINTSKVLVDDYEGAFKAVEHLILAGYKNIAHIGGPSVLRITYNRLNGYMDALKKYKMPIKKELIVHSDLSVKAAIQCSEKLLSRKNRPDAVFCVNDPTAIQLMLYAKSKGIKIPRELGVVGFSNDPMASVIEPSLTTIEQPVSDMGREAMRILLDAVKKGLKDFVPVRTSLQTKLIVRKSSIRK